MPISLGSTDMREEPSAPAIVPTPGERVGARFTVADFSVLVHVYKRRRRGSADVVLGLCFIGILAIGASVSSYGESHAWSSTSLRAILISTLVLSTIPHLLGWRRSKSIIRDLGLMCPHCNAPLVDGLRHWGRVQFISTTGTCPECWQDIVDLAAPTLETPENRRR